MADYTRYTSSCLCVGSLFQGMRTHTSQHAFFRQGNRFE